MSMSTRWTIGVLVAVAVLVAALALALPGPAPAPPVPAARGGGTQQNLADLRRQADLPPCPAGAGAGPVALRGITLTCAADGSPVAVARMVTGRAVLLNLWAYWCEPCRTELPAIADYQQRVGTAVAVITVHQDPNQAAGLQLLTDLGVRLPTLQDGDRQVAAALRVPNVMPASVLLRADGSVAATLPRAFANADEVAAAVDAKLGLPQ
jgi:thiol-disulfide isomerase/thioredoxin